LPCDTIAPCHLPCALYLRCLISNYDSMPMVGRGDAEYAKSGSVIQHIARKWIHGGCIRICHSVDAGQ
jgi:hypothetical protein